MNGRRAGAAVLALAVIFAAGCQGDLRQERKARGEVIMNIGSKPKTLDPGLSQDTNSSIAIQTFMRGLTVLDADGHPQPEIAERWEASENYTVYDFYLREDDWTNGERVTAGDFAYAWLHRMLNPKYGSEYAYILFDYIAGAKDYYEGKTDDPSTVGIEVVAPDHLRVRLTAPSPFFPQLAAHTSYYPVCESVDRANPNWATRAETYVGNGPFELTEWNTGYELVGKRRDGGYWNASHVAINLITLRFIEEETTERIAFENGELDGTYLVPRPEIEELRKTGTLHITPQIGTYYLNINMKREKFADVRVRRALALAIDRKAIVQYVTQAGEVPAASFVPHYLYGDLPGKDYIPAADFDEARRLLAEAGYPGGKGFPKLYYLYNTLEMHRQIAQVVQESWKKELGIEIYLENQEFKSVIENRNQGNFDIARNGWVADFADPINFLDLFLSYSGNNNSHWEDKHYDALIDRARHEGDAAERLRKLQEAEDYLMEVLPIIPIFHYRHPQLRAPDLEDSLYNPLLKLDAARIRWKTHPTGS